jgi:hypothetical protein
MELYTEDIEDLLTMVNLNYCIKSHLAERLHEMTELIFFKKSAVHIKRTIAELEEEISGLDAFFITLDISYTFENCNGVTTMLEEAYSTIHDTDFGLINKNLAVLYYLSSAVQLMSVTKDMIITITRDQELSIPKQVFQIPIALKNLCEHFKSYLVDPDP